MGVMLIAIFATRSNCNETISCSSSFSWPCCPWRPWQTTAPATATPRSCTAAKPTPRCTQRYVHSQCVFFPITLKGGWQEKSLEALRRPNFFPATPLYVIPKYRLLLGNVGKRRIMLSLTYPVFRRFKVRFRMTFRLQTDFFCFKNRSSGF